MHRRLEVMDDVVDGSYLLAEPYLGTYVRNWMTDGLS